MASSPSQSGTSPAAIRIDISTGVKGGISEITVVSVSRPGDTAPPPVTASMAGMATT